MDSMRSLNTSLPGTSPPKQQPAADTPESILSAFRAAALSVTQLYKTAAADQARSRSEGYQDALDELLAFLDKEDIGLSDGEGWRIRRWATERLDGRDSVPHNGESDDEASDKADRASSPILQRSQSVVRLQHPTPITPAPSQIGSSTPIPAGAPASEDPVIESTITPQSAFTFQSSHPYPQDTDVVLSDFESRENPRPSSLDTSTVGTSGTSTRSTRTTSRHLNHARLSNRAGSIGRGAGQKRKINIGDFFDIGNLGHGKDGFGGGGKRGRFI